MMSSRATEIKANRNWGSFQGDMNDSYIYRWKRIIAVCHIFHIQRGFRNDNMKLLIISLALCACNMAVPIEPSTQPLLELLSSSGFSELKEALVKHNMTNIINATEPMTIFAPSNEAFKNLKQNPWTKNMTHGMMEKLLGRLVVLRRKLLPADVRNEMIVDTASNEKLRLNVYPKVRTVNGIMVVMEPNVQSQQVIIYRVNRFPMSPPPGRDIFEMLNRRKERFSTLVRAIEVANLKETLKTGIR
ncbi:Uncharacterized protein APZ42_004018, partial [Daphnia magna]